MRGRYLRERVRHAGRALRGAQAGAVRVQRPLRPGDFGLHARRIEQPQVAVGLAVVGDFEQRIGHQLFGAGGVRAHPLAACKQRRFDALAAQIIEQIAVIAGNFAALLTQIERQSDQLFTRRQIDTADRAARGRRSIGVNGSERCVWPAAACRNRAGL